MLHKRVDRVSDGIVSPNTDGIVSHFAGFSVCIASGALIIDRQRYYWDRWMGGAGVAYAYATPVSLPR